MQCPLHQLDMHFEINFHRMQKEVIDYQKLIPDTEAGRHLRDILSLELQKRAQHDPDVHVTNELRMAVQLERSLRDSSVSL
jgi:hypothetical protein